MTGSLPKAQNAVNLAIWALISLFPLAASGQEEPETFQITGKVLDDSGNPVSGSVVVPLSEHGVPLARANSKPATMQAIEFSDDEDFILFAQTDRDGDFSLELPSGKYRLAAQSWPGKEKVSRLLDKNGSHLRIDGFTEVEFSNEMEASEVIEILPIGTAQLTVSSQEKSDMLLISTEPLACDIVLGFAAMMGDFWNGLVAGGAMERKEIVISGLPAGTIQVVSFVNDNNGGFGASRTTLQEGESSELYVGVIAGWSNGHRTPPEALSELTDYFVEHPEEAHRANQVMQQIYSSDDGDDAQDQLNRMQSLSRQLLDRLDEEFQLSSGEKTTLGNALAAAAYARMQKKQ